MKKNNGHVFGVWFSIWLLVPPENVQESKLSGMVNLARQEDAGTSIRERTKLSGLPLDMIDRDYRQFNSRLLPFVIRENFIPIALHSNNISRLH
jgi:hypothetical protein